MAVRGAVGVGEACWLHYSPPFLNPLRRNFQEGLLRSHCPPNAPALE